MSIIDKDIVRALKSVSWFSLDNILLDDLPVTCVRDLDFGDLDNSVFVIPSANWSEDDKETDKQLNRILLRILMSSAKFHLIKTDPYQTG